MKTKNALSYRETERLLVKTTRKLYRENMKTIKTMANRLKPTPVSDVKFVGALSRETLEERWETLEELAGSAVLDLKWKAVEHYAYKLFDTVLTTRDESEMASRVLWHIADAGFNMSALNPKAVESRLPRIITAMRPRMMKPFEDRKVKPGETGQILAAIIWFNEPKSLVAKYLNEYEERTIPKRETIRYRNTVGALLY